MQWRSERNGYNNGQTGNDKGSLNQTHRRDLNSWDEWKGKSREALSQKWLDLRDAGKESRWLPHGEERSYFRGNGEVVVKSKRAERSLRIYYNNPDYCADWKNHLVVAQTEASHKIFQKMAGSP